MTKRKATAPKVSKKVKAAPAEIVVTTSAAPIDEQNGIRKPRDGGKCAAVWSWMNDHRDATGAEVRTWASSAGQNPSNAIQEASRFRRFHGIARPKQSKQLDG